MSHLHKISIRAGDRTLRKCVIPFYIVAISSLFFSCSQSSKELALSNLDPQALIAANGEMFDIPGATNRLTPDDKTRLSRHYPSTLQKIENNAPLSMQDIMNLTRAGVSDDVIIYEIGVTASMFYLTPDDETDLEQAGVSFGVIDAMKQTTGTSY